MPRNPDHRCPRRQGGFTLVELLVVILIIGILIAVAAPSFLGQASKAEDSAAQQDLTVAWKEGRAAGASNAADYGAYPVVDAGPASTRVSGLVGDIQSGEPQLNVLTGDDCAAASASDPKDVIIDRDSSLTGLFVAYSKAADGKVWRMVATSTSAPTIQQDCVGPPASGFDTAGPDSTDSASPMLDVTPEGVGGASGTVSSDDGNISGCSDGSTGCDHLYGGGETVTLTATPTSGSDFAGWSGPCWGNGDCTVQMDQAQEIKPIFVPATSGASGTPGVLFVSVLGDGAVSAPGLDCPSGDNFDGDVITCYKVGNVGDGLTLTASAQLSESFYGWDDQNSAPSPCGTSATCSVAIGDHVEALFSGTGVSEADGVRPYIVGNLTDGSTLSINAGLWRGARPLSFSYQWYRCTAASDKQCLKIAGATSQTYLYDAANDDDSALSCVVVATNAQGSRSAKCAGVVAGVASSSGSSSSSTFTLTVNRAGSGSGTISSSGGSGSISCGSSCSDSFTSGDVVTLTAAPASSSTFSGWSGDCTGSGSCQVTMSAGQSVTATFVSSGSSLGLTCASEGAGAVGDVFNVGPTPADLNEYDPQWAQTGLGGCMAISVFSDVIASTSDYASTTPLTDGSVFTRGVYAHDTKAGVTVVADNQPQVWASTAGSTAETLVASGTFSSSRDDQFSLSPDGSKVAWCYMNGLGANDLYYARTDGSDAVSGPINLTNGTVNNQLFCRWGVQPSWSADGAKLLIAVNGTLETIDLSGNTQTVVAADLSAGEPLYVDYGYYAPSGKIVYVQEIDNLTTGQLVEANADGSSPVVITSWPDFSSGSGGLGDMAGGTYFAFSLTRNEMIFSPGTPESFNGPTDLWLVNLTSDTVTNLTSGFTSDMRNVTGGCMTQPDEYDFSPSGDWVVFPDGHLCSSVYKMRIH